MSRGVRNVRKGAGREPGAASARYRLFRAVVVALGRLFFGFTVCGWRPPERGPLIVAANHSQFFDPVFVCMAVPRRLQWMAKKQLFAFPFCRFFRFIGAFPVDREGGGRAGLRTALDLLSEGRALGIFPEGTRRRGPEDGAEGAPAGAKSGTVLLAARGGVEILPVYIGRIPGPLGRLRGERLRAYVGRPIAVDPGLRGRRSYRAEADRILGEIYALPERYGPRDPDRRDRRDCER